jgi:hypothetical protein
VHKEELINELKHLPGIHEGEITFSESHIGMLHANMLRIMGPAREYEKQMDRIFETCIERLSDEDSFNDSPTLRLLAKVLSSLDGLEFDARVALSAQFSTLDKEVHEAGLARLKMYDESESSESTPSKFDETDGSPASEPEGVIAGGDAPASTDDVTEVCALKEGQELEEHEIEQDITGEFFGITCDGDCRAEVVKWDQPFYLCLICPSVDLCAGCLEKKRASVRGEEENSWKRVCSPDHCFIKGPMKGWKGIKNGVIRIEGKEAFTVKQWLKEMKEDRWPRAWESYWLRQGGLRNIDGED